jgi:putative sterol carrier protein
MSDRSHPPDDIAPGAFFTRWIPEAVAGDPERRARLGNTRARIQFELGGNPGGTWTVSVEEGRVSGAEGPVQDPDLRIEVDMETWRALNRGELSAPEALLRRRLHFHGSFLLALKLHLILG